MVLLVILPHLLLPLPFPLLIHCDVCVGDHVLGLAARLGGFSVKGAFYCLGITVEVPEHHGHIQLDAVVKL